MGPPSYTWSVVNQNIAIQSMTEIQLHCIALFRKVGQRLSFLRCVCAKPFTKCEAENVQTKWFRIYHWNLMTGLGVTNIIINAAWVLRGDSQEPRQAQRGYEVCGHPQSKTFSDLPSHQATCTFSSPLFHFYQQVVSSSVYSSLIKTNKTKQNKKTPLFLPDSWDLHIL